jgi:hypothetical protein
VTTLQGDAIATDEDWRAAGSPSLWSIPWIHSRPPSILRVEWPSDGSTAEAYWPINVAASADLAPPEALRDLTLQELLEVLTSSGPLYAAVNEMVKRRTTQPAPAQALIDAHAKVDTRGFLLQRMRRFSSALEGMRERLSRPVNSVDALEWRLNGPIGPLTLAAQILKTEPEAAAFMIAEIAGLLRETRISGAVPASTVKAQVRQAIETLKHLAESANIFPALKAYVDQAFTEHLS